MNKLCIHQKIDGVDSECFLLTWLISKTSGINGLVQTMKHKMKNGNYYFATLTGLKQKIEFSVATNADSLTCSVSMFTDSGTLLYSNTLKDPTRVDCSSACLSSHYDLMSLTCADECFHKLEQHRNDGLILKCRIISRSEEFSASVETPGEFTDLNYMKKSADAFGSSSESSSKEKVTLQIGDETETVNKAVLCARSPVFANIFQSNMEDVKEKVIVISDITMPVLKVLISFLSSGKLPHSDSDMVSNGDFDVNFLCDIYRAADNYGITELCRICADLLLPRISMENIFQVSKLAFAHSEERLKSTVKALIFENIETLVDKIEWKDFINEEPKIVAEALTFFDI